MKTMKFFIVLVGVVTLLSCNNNKTLSSPQTVSFLLTDAPALKGFQLNFTKVNVQINEIDYVTADSSITKVTSFIPGVYDLKSLMNGDSTLLSQIILPNNVAIKQVRFVLGTDNSVTLLDGTTHALTIPSGQQSGIKINIDSTVPSSGDYSIMIDFNIGKSIFANGNGVYLLKPVLRAFVVEATSNIKGNVSPSNLPTKVFVVNGTDTISTMTDTTKNNYFQLSGFTSGNYTVQFMPMDTTVVTKTTAATVSFGSDTNLGTVVVQ